MLIVGDTIYFITKTQAGPYVIPHQVLEVTGEKARARMMVGGKVVEDDATDVEVDAFSTYLKKDTIEEQQASVLARFANFGMFMNALHLMDGSPVPISRHACVASAMGGGGSDYIWFGDLLDAHRVLAGVPTLELPTNLYPDDPECAEPEGGVWMSRQGPVPIAEMSDLHLHRSIRFAKKELEKADAVRESHEKLLAEAAKRRAGIVRKAVE